MLSARKSGGDTPPSNVIEVRVAELRQLFNAIDPSPFRERDLDPRAETFIVEWARDLSKDAPLSLLVHLGRACGPEGEATMLGDAIHEYFRQRALNSRRQLRNLFRRGRISLVIALAFLTAALAASDLMDSLSQSGFGQVFREGLLIVGWVAMWRPLEVFLYDWWPVKAEVRLSERLSKMPVKIEYNEMASPDAWQFDWPAVAAADDVKTQGVRAVEPPPRGQPVGHRE
jgi:hypothetical protein